MKSKKDIYRNLCSSENSIPLFMQDWWLDCVCGKSNWDVCIVHKDENVIAALPYFLIKKYGIKIIKMPKQTQFMGIWLKYPETILNYKKLFFEKKVITDLISQIPNVSFFTQRYHYSFTNWQPFYWKGFNQTTMYTYVLDDLTDLDKIYTNFKASVRTDIKKASKKVTVIETSDIESFYKINSLSFERQNRLPPYSINFIKLLDDELKNRGRRKMYMAADENDNIHAVLYIVWDNKTAYYLWGGSDPKYRQSGASSLLLWNAIQDAAKIVKVFDFEGSMIENVAYAFGTFGAKQKQYFKVYKAKNKLINLITCVR